jgi:ATP-dependent Lon protease
MLEVLDPEQNKDFVDHYVEVPVDLSKVMFICTANQLDTISQPLLDRMEMVELSGYTTLEKLAIAKNHLVLKQLGEHGIGKEQLQLDDEALEEIIHSYTREAGVRNLEREIAAVCRGAAVKVAEGATSVHVDKSMLEELLGPPRHVSDTAERKPEVGVITGLAWTPVGGDIMFIATANLPETIPPPLRDRMETLHLSGYAEEEKLAIAERYIIPKQIAEAGLTANEIVITRDVTRRIISEYTRESGLRGLEKLIAHLARRVARRVVEDAAKAAANGTPAPARGAAIGASELPTYLGPPRFLPEERHRAPEVGTVTGLAWTPYGGEVLHVEAQTMAGKGSLILTGQLGDVMKESAQAALSFARAQALALGLNSEFYSGREIHIHVPAGGVPKDGPSAGVTMACALVSLISGIPVRHDVAMTGELTLRGKVLPIGGLKEKLLAAARAGINTVIIPAANAPELAEIPAYVTAKLTIRPVRTMEEVLEIALDRPTGKKAGTAAKQRPDRRKDRGARSGIA